MTPLSKNQKGELLVFSEALIWSLFPVITILTYTTLMPLQSAAISTLISSMFFAVVLTIRRGWRECANAPWKDILLTSLFIGVIFYVLEFTGLKYTTAGNASIMNLMEVFFSFLILSVLWKHETLGPLHVTGALCMVIGAMIILLPKSSGWHPGDLIIMAACAFAPIGNKFAKRARDTVSSEFILFIRSLISGVVLCALAFLTEPTPSFDAVASSGGFLFVNGFLLFGFSKILWNEAVHLIPITKAISLASIAPLFTLIFAYFILHERIQLYQLAAFLPILIGVFLLTRTNSVSEIT